jgi:integrase
MSKRANGEGSIYKRADGRWCATLSLDQGKRKSFYGATRQEVARKLSAALKTREDGLPVLGERETLATYLARWLESARPSLRYATWVRYQTLVRLHIVPEQGRVPLARLAPQHLQRLYASRQEAGLSAGTVRQIHAVLRRSLGQAERWGLVPRNVARLVTPPRNGRKEMKTLSPEQARCFLEAAAGDRLEALYVLALTTGMRQGELLALRWQNVDPDAARLHVRGSLQRTAEGREILEPKTARSRRQVALTRAAVDALRRHRVAQAEERLRLGAGWEDLDLVFPNGIGRPLDPANLLHNSFNPLLKRAGLPAIP